MAPAAAAPQPTTADGIWRMDGYDTVLSIANGHLQEYQTTAVSCVKGAVANRTAPGTYSTATGTVFTVRPPGTLRVAGSSGDRTLHRLTELPAKCRQPMAKDPLTAFDTFWQTFEENYPFFAAKGIDWHAVRDTFRPKVHDKTTRAELLSLFGDMVKPLYDAHVVVYDGSSYFVQVRPGTTLLTPELETKVKNHVVQRDLHGKEPQEFANGRVSYADLPGGQGYLRISAFGGFHPEDPSYAAQLVELDKALDTVLTAERTASLKGLIIDVRANGGGYEALGVRIAERLTDTPYLAYSRRTQYTPPQPVRVTPAQGAPRYTGPVAVLTAGTTISAAETFTQALIDRPGKTVRVGEATQGVFSDVLERKLPNDMGFWLPNEELPTRSGRTFDGTGIPPHLRTPVFTDEEFDKNLDSAFDTAVAALRR